MGGDGGATVATPGRRDAMTRLAGRAAVLATVLCLIPLGGAQEEPELAVPDHGVGTEVVDRDLAGEKDAFAEGETVWFWTRVTGGADGDRIRHVWLREGEEMLSVGLTLGGPHWRTWSHKTLHAGASGAWVVEARDEDDRVLARSTFTCSAEGAGS